MSAAFIPTDHFIESSVARGILTGTHSYGEWLRKEMPNGHRFTSPFVAMELCRSYLCGMIEFYHTLNMVTISTVSDAIKFWSHRYQPRDVKLGCLIIGDLLSLIEEQYATAGVRTANPNDKAYALTVLADLIGNFEIHIRRTLAVLQGQKLYCSRAQVSMAFSADTIAEDLQRYLDEFDDVTSHKAQCSIVQLLVSGKADIDQWQSAAEKLKSTQANQPIRDFVNRVVEAASDPSNNCSCNNCGVIGDAVITLDAPRSMCLEHTDDSFNFLCGNIGQPHNQRPSEVAFHGGHPKVRKKATPSKASSAAKTRKQRKK